jgi:hypothetical protein
LPRQITLWIFVSPSAASNTGSEKMTFSPVLVAQCSSRILSGGIPRATIEVLMIRHSERFDPGVMPPLTIDQRKNPSRQSRQASSTLHATSSRVPNTNRRLAGLIGVRIKCMALISAISASEGRRV